MSIQRYEPEDYCGCNPAHDGDFVTYEDHLAEVERLKSVVDLFLNRPPGSSYIELVDRAREILGVENHD